MTPIEFQRHLINETTELNFELTELSNWNKLLKNKNLNQINNKNQIGNNYDENNEIINNSNEKFSKMKKIRITQTTSHFD